VLTRPLRGVLVDLEDTLYPRAEFVDTACRAVAAHGATRGLDPDALLGALREETARGRAGDELIACAVRRAGASPRHGRALLAAFRAADPIGIAPYPGVPRALALLRERVPVGLVADDRPGDRRRELAALGLADAFDVVVLRHPDEPRPAPLRRALAVLGVPAVGAVLIGDDPDGDLAGAVATGVRAVRVTTGEHAGRPDHPGTWFGAPCFAAAVRLLLPHLPPPSEPSEPPEAPADLGPAAAPADLAALARS
jgi:putative hydrolase of the HAD superfamily